ncbi:MAG: hypothetical protein HY870_14495 [Chloroflexi bacterium]|nr:hypothetical protein [Chloroflexota bacterium]
MTLFVKIPVSSWISLFYAHLLMIARLPRSISWLSVTLALLAVLAALPVWTGPGLVNTRGGGDSPFLFFRLHQLVANLHDGVFPARWMPDAAYGLGYPFFSYYAALPYYLGALFNLIGFDLLVSIKLVQTLGFGFAAWGMYRWAERHTPTRSAAWLMAVAYTFAPFHLINVYVRGDSLSEFYAFVFYPLILLSIDRAIESPRSFGWLALSYGGLIVTHNVSALIFSPFVLLYAAITLPKSEIRNQKSEIAALIGGLCLAFALSAWFWLPALGEAHLVQLDNQTTGYFNYAGHFRSANLIQTSIGFDYSIAADGRSSTPFAMGLAQAIGAGAGLIALIVTWRRARDRSFRIFVSLGLSVSTLMITPLSKVLWDTLPLLPLTQFPWRFLSIQALFASLTIGYLASFVTHHAPRNTLSITLAGCALAASVLLPLRPDYLPIRADEITPARLQLYEAFTGNIGTTIRAEYLPRTTIPRPYTGSMLVEPSAAPLRAIVSSGKATATQQARSTTRQLWNAQVESERATLAVPLLYWPGWTATIDGQAAPISAVPDLGYIQINVPQGAHQLAFELGRTPLRLIAEFVSLVTGGGLLVTGVMNSRRQGRRWRLSDRSIMAVELTLALGLAASVYQTVYTVADWPNASTLDFADKPWLHHNPGGVDFGGALLLDYDVAVTDRVKVRTDWQVATTPSPTATVSLLAPSTHFLGGPGPIVEQTQSIGAGVMTYDLALPYALPTGMYYLRVKSATREEYLSPLWIKSESETASAAFGKLTPAIGLAAAHTRLLSSDRLDVRLTWTVSGVIDANYSLALRLHDAAGKVWTSLDTQPGYGFQPTSAWRPGTLDDVYTLNLPADLPRDQVYAVDVIVYHTASQAEVGRTTIDGVRWDQSTAWRNVEPLARSFTLPALTHSLAVDYDDQIRLTGYELVRADRAATLTVAWQALRDIDQNYTVFVHVFDPATETIVTQSDVMPRHNAYPTSRWISGEVITDSIALSLADAPPGDYRIALGLFDETGRLPISGSGPEVVNRRVVLEEVIEVR